MDCSLMSNSLNAGFGHCKDSGLQNSMGNFGVNAKQQLWGNINTNVNKSLVIQQTSASLK